MNLQELNERKETLESEIADLRSEIDSFELNPDDYEQDYNDLIDDTYGEINIGVTLQASYVLKECDPTAYRCGLLDYVDGIELETVPAYQELQAQLETLEDELEDVEEAIDELEAEQDEDE